MNMIATDLQVRQGLLLLPLCAIPHIKRVEKRVTMKTCVKCGEMKPVKAYSYDKRNNDGRQSRCRICKAKDNMAYYRTPSGISERMFSGQNRRSRQNGMQPPTYSLQELRDWLFSSPDFWIIYRRWVASEYKKMLVPSVDRLDDYKPYSFENIRVVTWATNKHKAHADRKRGANNKVSLPVLWLSKSGIVLGKFHSMREAARNVPSAGSGGISSCCSGRTKTHAGYKWRYADDR